MALEAIRTTLDGLSDVEKAHYTETDGKFDLNVIPVDGRELQNVTGLQTALASERGNVKQLRKDLKAFEGFDAVKSKEAIEKVAEFEAMDLPKQQQEALEVQKKALVETHNVAARQAQAKYDTLKMQHEVRLVDSAIREALTPEVTSTPSLLMPHIRNQVKMTEVDNGMFIAQIIDEQGNPRVGDTNGNPMTIPQLVAKMSQDKAYAPLFQGANASGSGAPAQSKTTSPSGGAVKTVSRTDQPAMNANIDGIADGSVKVVD